jgi:hypothetical protein
MIVALSECETIQSLVRPTARSVTRTVYFVSALIETDTLSQRQNGPVCEHGLGTLHDTKSGRKRTSH